MALLGIERPSRGWGDGSVILNTCCSGRGHVCSWHPCWTGPGLLQLQLWEGWSDLCGRLQSCAHIHVIKTKINLFGKVLTLTSIKTISSLFYSLISGLNWSIKLRGTYKGHLPSTREETRLPAEVPISFSPPLICSPVMSSQASSAPASSQAFPVGCRLWLYPSHHSRASSVG